MPMGKPPQDDPAQSQRFIDMAREVEAEDAERFDELFEKVTSLPIGLKSQNKPRKV
jgi:hypothetical protein